MVVFQALTWESRDTDDEHLISIFGKTEEGKSVCLTTAFTPYFFIKLPEKIDAGKIRRIYNILDEKCKDSLVAYSVMKSKDVWGFQNNEEFVFMKVNFKHLQARRLVDSFLRKPLDRTPELFNIFGVRNVKVYESNLDPVLRLMHRTGIQSTGWLDTGDKCIRSHLARVDLDLFCNDWTTLKPVARDDIAPFVVASVDIECNSSTGKFPDADVTGDACFQIAISLCKFGSDEPYDKTCLCYKKTDPNLEGSTIRSYETEREMLEAFQKYLHTKDVDIITGWNIFGFDMEYIYKRAQVNRCHYEFFNLGKLRDTESELVIKKLSSSALGDNLLKLLPMPGRFIFDMFHEVKKGYKLDSYKLDNVSKLYLGDQKIDMAPKEMFARYREEDPVKLREVAEYCIKDTLLPHRLMKKLCTLLNMVEMAKATWVPANFLVERGQQIKVFSQLTKKARELGFMVPTIRYGAIPEEPYEGATVLEAQKGAYYTPITALDFEALYPSIMMAHNLCYSSYVMDEKRYGSVPGITYETFNIGDRTYKFAQDVPSLLPAILAELKQFRKQAKRDMAAATGFMKEVYNGKQLAYKVSMNSVYGFTGAGKGILPCVPIASTTTSKGRSMIEETKNYVEKNFPGAKVRYGDTDSVMVEFDVGDRKGEEAIAYSWEVGERAAEECSALFKKPNNLELEKVYWPYFLYSKKRYAAKLWTKGKDGKMHMDYIDIKGLQVVRRDNTPHVREVCKELLDVILTSSDPGPPKELAKERAIELLSGDVPNDKLILSQGLSDTYKVGGKNVSVTSADSVNINQSHVQVVTKMRQRKPGSEPQSGDRVPYLLTKTQDPKAKAYEKAEDPKYVEEHGVPVDYHYYFLNKFLNPVCDLLDPLYENVKEDIFGEIINAHKPVKPPKLPSLSGMKKDDLIAECQRLGLEETGTLAILRARLKDARHGSVEDLFKNYELTQSKDESS
ncbi:putative DNA polymerase [Ostreococcus tauri virus OtV5]|uniref:DNA polymerase n=2 Tax=Prasinovirus TaxID=181084 RepID=A9YWD7_9PHYC|nr:putative DNA polymerase [Ostreococcus tauri virus OtV5]ABY28020.1 putative DNA polymerase [Ostreococcus tauri virus OtV5]